MKILGGLLALLFANTICCAATRLVYINGINVDDAGRIASELQIQRILSDAGYLAKLQGGTPGSNNLTVQSLPNLANGLVNDVEELVLQAKYSGEALTTAKITEAGATAQSQIYRDHLGRLYAHKIVLNLGATDVEKRVLHFTMEVRNKLHDWVVRDGDQVIVVSHSQGNFFAEAAHAYLYASITAEHSRVLDKNLRFVGVASVAASTPSGRYISADEDQALHLYTSRTLGIENFSLLGRNADLCKDGVDGPACIDDLYFRDRPAIGGTSFIHGFVTIYASACAVVPQDCLVEKNSGRVLSRILADYISASFDELVFSPPPVPNETGLFTIKPGDTISMTFRADAAPSIWTPFSLLSVMHGPIDAPSTATGTGKLYADGVLVGTTLAVSTRSNSSINYLATEFLSSRFSTCVSSCADLDLIGRGTVDGRVEVTLASGQFMFDVNQTVTDHSILNGGAAIGFDLGLTAGKPKSISINSVVVYLKSPTLTISSPIVPIGGSATLSWNTGGASVSTCTLTQGSTPLPLANPTGSVVIPDIQGQIRFTLACGASSVNTAVGVIPLSGG